MQSTSSIKDQIPSNSPDSCLIADMYERWTLDSVIEVVQAISMHFVYEPNLYRLVPEDIATILQDFWYKSGTEPNFPDLDKRMMIFAPILGPSDGNVGEHMSDFHMNSGALKQSADKFTNRIFDTGEGILREDFRNAAITFQAFLRPFEDNTVVTIGDTQTRGMFAKAVQVLLNEAVTSVIARPPASDPNWPQGGTYDVNGALVIEKFTQALETTLGIIPQGKFIFGQQIGFFGKKTIKMVLEANLGPDISADELDEIISSAYQWYMSGNAFSGDFSYYEKNAFRGKK